MVAALRKSKSASKVAVPRSQTCASRPAGNQYLSEASLRKLSRAELQKLAREHAVKANLKSEHIIQHLLKVVSATKKNIRPAEKDHEEGPSKKRARTAKAPLPSTPESRLGALLDEVKKPQLHSANTLSLASQPSPPIAGAESLKDPVFDPDLYSDTDSEMTDVTQPSYGTPKSSRANTPQPSDVYDAKRTVDIMQAISEKDLEMLAEIAKLRETAAKLRKQTQDIRDMACSERARRERMEAYFTYWQNIEGTWPRKWLYGESMLPQKYLRPNGGVV
ncbi:hypothetical protein SCLCIDRAFT_116396 [Scleroderma citrinum Foug A]|uniref:Uncharacterized protein n=1 Tax=Scleroderma citrinum Foug A TaxID=1036808 RepID=A0A0C2ZQW0_9AGAM|nr:hypothetical protein SCLCIDRAFT_116396 [Scleroderma citrinum Foug A]